MYLAVVNNTRKPINDEIGLDGEFKALVTLQGEKGCSLKKPNTVSVSFEGMSAAFLRLTP